VTENPPPRKPRRARWWPYAVALLLGGYVAAYVGLRARGRLCAYPAQYWFVSGNANEWLESQRTHRSPPPVEILEPTESPGRVSLSATFHPCIAVEEWWRSR